MQSSEPLIVLASASPRRRELLAQIGVPHEVLPVDIDERRLAGESPRALVERLALEKALAGWERSGAQLPVLGSDTLVVVDDEVLGKPRDLVDARRMLGLLSGRAHQVLTAVALVKGPRSGLRLSESTVHFAPLSAEWIERYWATGEPADKAGGYAVQGLAATRIRRIEGSFSGIMGLPLFETTELLAEFGIDPTLNWQGNNG
ncbi:MAG: septum formation inhibitor Maf [Gammaproteobacteria bacterium]|nr:MAG: septum formation inhibitor Maf [Gammaproteobacteria bacterium]